MPTLNPQTRDEILAIKNPAMRLRWQKYYSIPEDLQNHMFEPTTAESIWDIINDKYQLGENNVSVVAKTIGLIFLGELPIKNFIAELKTKLNIDITKAQAIAQDINQTIFQPVRTSLMQVHGINDANQRMDTNDTNKNTNINQSKSIQPTRYQTPSRPQPPSAQGYGVAKPVKLIPPAYQPNYNDAQKRRDDVLNKIRQQPPTAKPASFYFSRTIRPNKLKPAPKKKNISKYNSFFT